MKTIDVLKCLDRDTKAEVFLVGGFVRDYLRNKYNNDLDVVIRNLSLKNINKFLLNYGNIKEVPLSKTSETTIKIMLFKASGDTVEAQISLPRRGKKQIPNSNNTLRQDVKFRDFRLNTLYLPINYKSKADIIDLVGGREDIVNRKIVSNGSPVERMKESPIRMLRAISLAARTEYKISEKIINAITNNVGLINKCPAEAIRREFEKIIMSRKPSKYIRLLLKTGLLKVIAPEVQNCAGVKQDTQYHKYDVFTHLIYTVDNCDCDLVIRLSGLLHDIGKPSAKRVSKSNGKITFHKHEMVSVKLAKTFLRRMKFDLKIQRQILFMIRNHMYHYTREWTDTAIRKFIRKMGITEHYLTEATISSFPLFRLRAGERLGSGFKNEAVTDRQRDFEKRLIATYNEGKYLEVKDLAINGNTIMEIFNIGQGMEIGKILKFLLNKILEDPKVNTEVELLKLTAEYLHGQRKE